MGSASRGIVTSSSFPKSADRSERDEVGGRGGHERHERRDRRAEVDPEDERDRGDRGGGDPREALGDLPPLLHPRRNRTGRADDRILGRRTPGIPPRQLVLVVEVRPRRVEEEVRDRGRPALAGAGDEAARVRDRERALDLPQLRRPPRPRPASARRAARSRAATREPVRVALHDRGVRDHRDVEQLGRAQAGCQRLGVLRHEADAARSRPRPPPGSADRRRPRSRRRPSRARSASAAGRAARRTAHGSRAAAPRAGAAAGRGRRRARSGRCDGEPEDDGRLGGPVTRLLAVRACLSRGAADGDGDALDVVRGARTGASRAADERHATERVARLAEPDRRGRGRRSPAAGRRTPSRRCRRSPPAARRP